jgi:hypothetical protein
MVVGLDADGVVDRRNEFEKNVHTIKQIVLSVFE